VGEHSAATGDAALDRADRDVEHRCDLGIVEVGDITQHHRHAEVLRQGQQRSIEQVAVTELLDAITGRGVGSFVAVAYVGALLPVLVAARQQRPAPAPAQLVEAGVGGDAVCPGTERGTTVEAGQPAHHRRSLPPARRRRRRHRCR
jgi:hypothetical protein